VNKFELSPAFLIGHKKIDSDHATLVEILNRIVDSFNSGDLPSCQKQWHLFCEKLQQHFADEEKIMDNLGFDRPGNDHQHILENIKSLGTKCETQNCWEDCLFAMRNELLSWILKKDLYFAEYLVTIGYNDG